MTASIDGKRLRDIRERRGFSSKDLAKKVHVNPVTLSRIENGKLGASYELMRRLSDALDCRTEEISTENLLGKKRLTLNLWLDEVQYGVLSTAGDLAHRSPEGQVNYIVEKWIARQVSKKGTSKAQSIVVLPPKKIPSAQVPPGTGRKATPKPPGKAAHE